MKNNKNLKKIIVSSLIGVISISSVALAANEIFNKKLTATHGRIHLSYQGVDITNEVENKYGTPSFTVAEYDHRAYVPVRAIADILGVDVTYDTKTHTANFTDMKKALLEQQVKDQAMEIERLNKEIKKIKETQKEEPKVDDLKSLEKDLNKKYGVTNGVYFDIRLKEASNRIILDINIDTKDSSQRSDWRRMNQRDREYFIQDIVSDIQKEYKNTRVEGSIYDNYERLNVLEYYTNNNNKVIFTDRDYGRNDLLDDVEYYIDSNLSKYAKVDKISVNEKSNSDIYGTVTLRDENKIIRDTDMDNAFYYAEESLISRYGKNVYLDIEVYIGSKYFGRYSNGKWSYK